MAWLQCSNSLVLLSLHFLLAYCLKVSHCWDIRASSGLSWPCAQPCAHGCGLLYSQAHARAFSKFLYRHLITHLFLLSFMVKLLFAPNGIAALGSFQVQTISTDIFYFYFLIIILWIICSYKKSCWIKLQGAATKGQVVKTSEFCMFGAVPITFCTLHCLLGYCYSQPLLWSCQFSRIHIARKRVTGIGQVKTL